MKIKFSQKQLLQWYALNGRDTLPWRNTDNIYHIYLSEIMLQQTQVSRVMEEYYPRFLEKFPTIEVLADSPLDEVLTAWSGLGYYRRARNLHKSAQMARSGLPNLEKELIKLPGIGRYTASAVCSFGYHQSVPVVDTNIARVLKRYFALLNPKDSLVWEYAQCLLNTQNPRSHNLALMDLGSLVCLPKNPTCRECPLFENCQGKAEPEIYTKVKKKVYESLELFYGVLIQNNQVALKISDTNMYKDMLVLPSVDPIEDDFLGEYKHSYTKYRLNVKLYKVNEINEEIVWVDLDKLDEVPISSLTKKAIKFF